MVIVGFNFTKINVERKSNPVVNININNNVVIKNVEEMDISLGKVKQECAKVTYEFTSKYEPNVGSILLEGEVMFMDEPKKVKDIVAGWKKDKKLPKEVTAAVMNNILMKCNIQALILSQDINLPPPIPLPKVEETNQGKK